MDASFGANSTAMTFAGAKIEAAILTDSDEEVEQIQILETTGEEKHVELHKNQPGKKAKDYKKVVSPRSRVPLKAAKKFELGKKVDTAFLEEPLPEIVLTD